MRLEPVGDKVIIRRIEEEETTRGGIVLPDTARETSRIGRVLSVGDGRRLADGSRYPPQVQEGDRVLFDQYSGTEVDVDGEPLLIVSEGEILAVLES